MSIYHKHHILPKHAGGGNEPENIVELTIKQHAEEHRKLYEQYGRWQDKAAWMALSGILSGEEVMAEAQKQAGYRTRDLKIGVCGQTKEKMINNGKKTHELRIGLFNPRYDELRNQWREKAHAKRRGTRHSDESKDKMRHSIKQSFDNGRIPHRRGKRHSDESIQKMKKSQDRMWITDGANNKRILKNETIPEGFRRGRIMKMI